MGVNITKRHGKRTKKQSRALPDNPTRSHAEFFSKAGWDMGLAKKDHFTTHFRVILLKDRGPYMHFPGKTILVDSKG